MAALDKKMSSIAISSNNDNGYPSMYRNDRSTKSETKSMPRLEAVVFVEKVPDDLYCSLCLDVFSAPCLTSCGHQYCSVCISPVVASGGSCPVCREEGFTIMRNKAEERRIDAMSVYCSFREKGCDWVGVRASLGDHIKTACSFADTVACLFERFGCSEYLIRGEINAHLKSHFTEHMLMLAAAKETQRQEMAAYIEEKDKKISSLVQRLQSLEMQTYDKLKLKSDILWHPIPLSERTHIGGFNAGVQPGQTLRCPLPMDLIPRDSKEILLHVAICAGHSLPDTDRYWLEVFVTDKDGTKYGKTTLMSTRKQNAYSDNSENMWFPMPADQTVYLNLPQKNKALQKRAVCKIYVIGYKS